MRSSVFLAIAAGLIAVVGLGLVIVRASDASPAGSTSQLPDRSRYGPASGVEPLSESPLDVGAETDPEDGRTTHAVEYLAPPHPLPAIDGFLDETAAAFAAGGIEVQGACGFHPYSDDSADMGTFQVPLARSVLATASGSSLAYRRVFIRRDDVLTLGVTNATMSPNARDASLRDVSVYIAPDVWQYAQARHAARVQTIALNGSRTDAGVAFVFDNSITASYTYQEVFQAARHGTPLRIGERMSVQVANSLHTSVLSN